MRSSVQMLVLQRLGLSYVGWVLAGPVEGVSSHTCNNLVVTHASTIDTHEPQDTDQEIDKKLKGFRVIWYIEE